MKDNNLVIAIKIIVRKKLRAFWRKWNKKYNSKIFKKNFLNFKIIKLIYLLNQNEEGIKLIVDEIEEIINGEYSLNSLWNIYIHYG